MDQLVLTLVILLAAVLAEPLGTRIGLAPSILMTLFGCLLALIPAVPGLNIPPELILPLVLPPLLYAAARRTSWRQFAENWQIIALRAVGLVIVTAIAVAAVFHAWNPATTVAAAVVLGALVAPPDTVAATSMAGSLGLPRCLIVTLGEMLITGFAFALIGLELRVVIDTTGHNRPSLAWVALTVIAVVVGLRLVWLMATWAVSSKLPHADAPFTWREVIVTWWAGMRGVATVALALAVPFTLDTGADFPARSEILFIAFAVVLFTLLIQGPTLPLVVRLTGVQIGTRQERAVEQALWTRVVNAELKAIAARDDLPEDIYTEIKDTLRRLSAKADPELAGADAEAALDKERKSASQMRAVRAAVTEAGRREAQAARREPGMPPDVVDRVTRRLDLGPTR